MRLQKCNVKYAGMQVVECCQCKGQVMLYAAYADLTGNAWIDYYCRRCIDKLFSFDEIKAACEEERRIQRDFDLQHWKDTRGREMMEELKRERNER